VHMLRLFLITIVSLSLLTSCSSSSNDNSSGNPNGDSSNTSSGLSPTQSLNLTSQPAEGEPLNVTIRRTTAGVPHIEGDDLASVTAGLGYAQAEDHLCLLAEGMLKVRGERAEFFGRGPDDSYVISDLSYKALKLRSSATDALAEVSDFTGAMVRGFVAGYNHYLATSNSADWPSECRDAAWVRPIDEADLIAYYGWVARLASGDLFASGALLAALPPGAPLLPTVVSLNPDAMQWENNQPSGASNAWGIGSELSENGRGALLANPHFPYSGSLRFYQSHLTIPGELNINGAGLLGAAIPLIMFNEDVAWSHTFSESRNFTVYRLELDPEDPMRYIKDGVSTPITAETIQVKLSLGGGEPITLERQAYYSEYGPMVSMNAVTDGEIAPWTEGQEAYTLRDANTDTSFLDTWLRLGAASNLSEFQQVFQDCGSTLWVNSIYADKEGNAFYIDSSSVPYLSDETLNAIDQEIENDDLYAALFFSGLTLLDGTSSRDDWIEGDCNGRVPYDEMPKLQRADFVQNSNSSYWTTNPNELITGISPLYGDEEFPVNSRTRIGLQMLSNPTELGFGETAPAGDDGKFSALDLLQVIWNNRAFFSEAFLPEVLERCELIGDTQVQATEGEPSSVSAACDVLANWSGNYNSDAVGAHLFRTSLLFVFNRDDLEFAVDFDISDPANTPSGIFSAERGNENDPILQSILDATRLLDENSIPIDATLGSVQTYAPSGGAAPGETAIVLADALPWHGGDGFWDGAFNAVETVGSDVRQDTILPRVSNPTVQGTNGLSATPGEGWNIARGTSWHFGLQFNDDGPEAWGLLSYGQSSNPNQPWYTEQSSAYANKEPRRILFTEDEIEAAILPDGVSTLEIEF